MPVPDWQQPSVSVQESPGIEQDPLLEPLELVEPPASGSSPPELLVVPPELLAVPLLLPELDAPELEPPMIPPLVLPDPPPPLLPLPAPPVLHPRRCPAATSATDPTSVVTAAVGARPLRDLVRMFPLPSRCIRMRLRRDHGHGQLLASARKTPTQPMMRRCERRHGAPTQAAECSCYSSNPSERAISRRRSFTSWNRLRSRAASRARWPSSCSLP
jgi:hypothetical protein